jgi:hypothetical protein
VKVLEPGHLYELDNLDGPGVQVLRFVKRVGEKYPGNSGEPYAGTTMQEVLRALANRLQYVDGQQPCDENDAVLSHLFRAIYTLEKRAARLHGRNIKDVPLTHVLDGVGKCSHCGHVGCHGDCQVKP